MTLYLNGDIRSIRTRTPKVNPDQQQATQFFVLFNKYTMELRYPFTTNPSSTIYGLAFFEAAKRVVMTTNYIQSIPYFCRSAGLGMRFFLPMFGLIGSRLRCWSGPDPERIN